MRKPRSVEELIGVIRSADRSGLPISIAGARHAMGGQQFCRDALLVDATALNRVIGLDPVRGTVEVEAGVCWPQLIRWLIDHQPEGGRRWGIIQKQSGADRLTIGGSLSANIHGRGLRFRPFVQDVESFVLVDAAGRAHTCSRGENRLLFRLAIGGYGLVGAVASVKLRLMPRTKLRREVSVIDAERLMPAFEEAIRDGCLYGDFQYATDPDSPDFLRRGVFSRYRPVAADTPIPPDQHELRAEDWRELAWLAHEDRARAFRLYCEHYRRTHGQVYWSDTHQLSVYLDDYHRHIDQRCGGRHRGSEMIGEVFVPRDALTEYLRRVRPPLRRPGAGLVYGTIRLIERDEESFLAWARRPYACVIFNLHTAHHAPAVDRTRRTFVRLIDEAIRLGGSYYPTYHRWATGRQVNACYPQLGRFVELKRSCDPDERFRSDWYDHHVRLLAGTRAA